jgi:hypothetical protein
VTNGNAQPLSRLGLAPWPEWLTPVRQASHTYNSSDQGFGVRPRRIPDHYQVDNLLRFVATSAEGERNARLFWAACRAGEMLMPGVFSASEAIRLLADAAISTGLEPRAAVATAQSGLDAGSAGR